MSLENHNLAKDPKIQISGYPVDLVSPYLLVIFHPNTTQNDDILILDHLLKTIKNLNHQVVWLWPNIDAGSDAISKKLRIFRETEKDTKLGFLTNLPPDTFQKLLSGAACAIGNSSSFVRDTNFSGVPVVLIGQRQRGREKGENVTEVNGCSRGNPKGCGKAA